MAHRKRHTIREEDVTLKLAMVDTIPVLFFLAVMVALFTHFPSILFILGASCSLIAGLSKVVWKFIMALKRGNKKWLSALFIPFQCAGFLFMIASGIVDRRMIHPSAVWSAITGFPSGLFFAIGIIGMVAMLIMSTHFDQSLKAHWKAQLVNTVAQVCFFVGMVLVR